MDLDILNQHTFTILWIICLLTLNLESCQAKPGSSSGERVHIRLHMPEVVRQHTHYHNVYKYHPKIHPVPAPVQAPTAIASSPPKYLGKPHVQLLGYTTSVGSSGPMAPNLMQLMATAATPSMMPSPTSLMPNYGPALFDNYNQDAATPLSVATTTTTMRPLQALKAATKQQQMLQQLFSAPQQADDEDTSSVEDNQVENNSLLNNSFLEALQKEYLSKFGGRRKRKKSSSKLKNTSIKDYSNNYRSKPYYYQDEDLSENFEDYQDEPQDHEDYEEVMMMSTPSKYGGYYPTGSEEAEDQAQGYDTAVAFSGQDNSISSSIPTTMEDFLDSVNNPGSSSNYDPYDNWQPYSTSPTMSNSWSRPTTNSYTNSHNNSSKSPKSRPIRSRGRKKIRYVKLITRKKRKNHIRTKRYRI
ncbi:uncharacterized protein [Drosophila kikkawai]|uniref:Uncharacterized protein n=1 Tax=Drosophila kikkawai TaxID=30033 RepID=A0A6P4HRC9_DROKI|nr:uncharacterized protein LOC108072042 [Drosophila kikkawai]